MINLERSKNKKWIFQKNISSPEQIGALIEILNKIRDVDKDQIKN